MSQGLITIPGFKYNGGIGYVAIPKDLDRSKYIKDCYTNSQISMWTEEGGFHNRIPVPPEVMNFLEFPTSIDKLGTPVIYITDEQYQHHYIVNRLLRKDSLGSNTENKFKFTKELDSAHVEISGSAKDRTINLLIDSADKDGQLTINLFSQNKNCKLKLDVQGDIDVNTTGNVDLEQYGSFSVKTIDEDDNSASFEQTSSENKFYNKKLIVNDGDEPMILGNKLVDFLNKFIDRVSEIQTVTKLGLQPIVNKIEVIELKEEVRTILSEEGYLNK